LQTLPREQLAKLAEKIEWEGREEGGTKSKNVYVKKINEQLASSGVKQFLKNLSEDELKAVIKLCQEEDDPEPKGKHADLVDQILTKADEYGLEYTLSTFPVQDLQKIASASELSVQSSSVEHLMTSIMQHKNYKAPKKQKKEPAKPSKSKQDIKKGISKADLYQWYYRGELADWLKEKGEPHTGNKRELINRITDKLNGVAPKKHRKKGVKRTASRKAKKSKSEEESEGEAKKTTPKKGTGATRGRKKSTKSEKSTEETEKSEKSEMETSEKSEKSEKTTKGSGSKADSSKGSGGKGDKAGTEKSKVSESPKASGEKKGSSQKC